MLVTNALLSLQKGLVRTELCDTSEAVGKVTLVAGKCKYNPTMLDVARVQRGRRTGFRSQPIDTSAQNGTGSLRVSSTIVAVLSNQI